MPKAINWPKEFYNEVMDESTKNNQIALRIGSLYYDTGYYNKGDIVDIRVDSRAVRKACVIEDMLLFKIADIPDYILECNKTSLRNKENVIQFLSKRYEQPVNEETEVTVITYRNFPHYDNEDAEDPHL